MLALPRLLEFYRKEVVKKLSTQFGYSSVMEIPRLKKITLNMGLGEAMDDKKVIVSAMEDLEKISGQKPVKTVSKKSIAGFKLRENLEIAAVVTLRKERMWDFLERLIYLSLPRSRDFKGLEPKSIDKNGNLSIGFKEHIFFPEIFTEKEKTIFGLEITVVTNAKSKEEGLELYKLMGFPMKETK